MVVNQEVNVCWTVLYLSGQHKACNQDTSNQTNKIPEEDELRPLCKLILFQWESIHINILINTVQGSFSSYGGRSESSHLTVIKRRKFVICL